MHRYHIVGLDPNTDRDLAIGIERLQSGVPYSLPKTGVLSRQGDWIEGVVSSKGNAGQAPLEIKTTAGSNYFIKVVSWVSKEEVLTAFVRGGEAFETLLPVGSYEVKYASGQDWYGPILDFGPDASYSRCDDRFDFKKTFDGYIGYTIELIKQVNGNLETEPISADDF